MPVPSCVIWVLAVTPDPDSVWPTAHVPVTVPPTVALATRTFGAREAPVVFGWVNVGHQLGAATAAFGAGLVRQEFGSYNPAFVIAGIFGVVAAGLLIAQIASGPRYRLQPA